MKNNTFLILIISTLLITLTTSECLETADLTGPLPNYTSTVPQPCSYSGFAPLDANGDDALFYWYIPNQQQDEDAPVVIWLNGGPGWSSLWGLLTEKIGPFYVEKNSEEIGGHILRNLDEELGQSWSYHYNVLAIDNPVGTGFSYTKNGQFPTTIDQVSESMWKLIQHFMTIHPETQALEWVLTGESYAARYVPGLGYWIKKFNEQIVNGTLTGTQINLKAIAVGNGYFHGRMQRTSGVEASIKAGFIGPNQIDQFRTIALKCDNLAAKNGFESADAAHQCFEIFEYFKDVSGVNALNVGFSQNHTNDLDSRNTEYLNHPDVVAALNADTSKKTDANKYTLPGATAKEALIHDNLNTSIPYLEYLLFQNLSVLIFTGTEDFRDGSYGAYRWMRTLSSPYNLIVNRTRNIWFVDGEASGYWQTLNNLHYVQINFAGHFVPYLQLDNSVKMLETFLEEESWAGDFVGQNISSIMCDYQNLCSGQGTCNELGQCVCNEGFALADCSEPIETHSSFFSTKKQILNPRGYSFFRVRLISDEQFIRVHGQVENLQILYSFDHMPIHLEDSEGVVKTSNSRSQNGHRLWVYAPEINKTNNGNEYIYISVQNLDYNSAAEFELKSISKEPVTSSLKAWLFAIIGILGGITLLLIIYVCILRKKLNQQGGKAGGSDASKGLMAGNEPVGTTDIELREGEAYRRMDA